ncbi:MAG TPA: hypothetical protein GX392_08305 [Clostridiales bacterium]|nr:hypothetical protein [Clostridiales bacterium]
MEEIKSSGFGTGGLFSKFFGGNILSLILIFFLLILLFGDGFCILNQNEE